MIDIKDELLKRLLSISEDICIEEDALADLSAIGQENTERFNKHVEKLLEFLNKETIILNTLSIEKLNNFQKILLSNDKQDDTAIAFNRLFQLIQDKLDEREEKKANPKETKKETNNNDIELDYDDEDDYDEDDDEELEIELVQKESEEFPILNEIKDDIDLADNYYMESFNLEKYLSTVIDRISIIVAKKMYQRINTTEASTKAESKYKKQLLKYFKEFKYYIFTLDYRLERLGATHSFNIEAIPDIPEIKEDVTPLYHNQCINILDDLYSSDIGIRKSADVLRLLYDLMCLEEYIKYLDDKSLNNLIAFCEDIEEMLKTPNFGQYGKARIKQRLGKNS